MHANGFSTFYEGQNLLALYISGLTADGTPVYYTCAGEPFIYNNTADECPTVEDSTLIYWSDED